jgi:hypothetical protein
MNKKVRKVKKLVAKLTTSVDTLTTKVSELQSLKSTRDSEELNHSVELLWEAVDGVVHRMNEAGVADQQLEMIRRLQESVATAEARWQSSQAELAAFKESVATLIKESVAIAVKESAAAAEGRVQAKPASPRNEAISPSDNQQEAEEAWSLPSKGARRSSNFVNNPFVDENGWTRVGTQPIKVYPFVQTAPASTAKAILRASVRGNLVETDARLPGNESVAQRINDIQYNTYQRLIPHPQGRVEMVCDYTGSISSWSPSPLRISMEAILPYTIVNGEILYHHTTNVCNTMVSLNLMKRGHPILVLPLLGEFLRAHQEPDFRRRKAVWTWTYTALANVATMNKIFHCVLDHAAQIERWVKWSPDKQKAVLGHLRTGKPGPAVWEELATWDQYDLLRDINNQFRKTNPDAQKVHWASVYQSLLKIGLKYGLTHEEFETYCTISTSSGRRVFYPYHIMSRPQGKRMWSWNVLYSTVKIMLSRMQTSCNKHAQAAGLGEDGMDPLRFIYWWAHHWWKKVQGIKCERPTASREEVACCCWMLVNLAFSLAGRAGWMVAAWCLRALGVIATWVKLQTRAYNLEA